MPEFEVGLLTIRSGARMVRVTAGDSLAARTVLQAECDAGQCDCPPEMCTDDVETTIRYVKQIALDDVTLITADGVALGTLYTDDSLRKKESHGA